MPQIQRWRSKAGDLKRFAMITQNIDQPEGDMLQEWTTKMPKVTWYLNIKEYDQSTFNVDWQVTNYSSSRGQRGKVARLLSIWHPRPRRTLQSQCVSSMWLIENVSRFMTLEHEVFDWDLQDPTDKSQVTPWYDAQYLGAIVTWYFLPRLRYFSVRQPKPNQVSPKKIESMQPIPKDSTT